MAKIYYPPSQDFLQKTLDAELLTATTAAATLNNATGIQDEAGIFIIDRIDSNGNDTPSKVEVIGFAGTSGSTVITLERGLAGTTAKDHAVGAIVEFSADVVQFQSYIDTFLEEHATDGSHTNALVTTLKASGSDVTAGTSDLKIVTPKALSDAGIGALHRAFTWFLDGTEIARDEAGAKYIVPQNMTAVKVYYQCTSGTATIRIQKGTTDIVNSLSVSSSQGSSTSMSSAALTAGDVLSLDLTAASSPVGIIVTLECTEP